MKVWEEIKKTALLFQKKEPAMSEYLEYFILSQPSLAHSLSTILIHAIISEVSKLDLKEKLFKIMVGFFKQRSSCAITINDLEAFRKRDPACRNLLSVVLFYKGFQALAIHRVAHFLWQEGDIMLPLYLQAAVSRTYTIDIHPAAKIAGNFFIDHGNSIVIGETCIIDKGVSILQDVTLGGTGKERGDRHPKIGKGVLVGAGAKILGNIKIGDFSKIGASSVVLKDIPPNSVAVGIPATVIGKNKTKNIAKVMDHSLDC